MNSPALPMRLARIVAGPEGLHGLSDPYKDLTKLFILDYPRHQAVTQFWLAKFFAEPGTLAILCTRGRIVSKAVLRCAPTADGKLFGHIGHFSSLAKIPYWELLLIHALVGYAKGTVSDLIIARNGKHNRHVLKSDFVLPVSVGATTAP